MNSAAWARSGGVNTGVSDQICAKRCPRQRSIAMPVCHASLPTQLFHGQSDNQIPSGSQPGKIFHIKGKGVPHLHRKDHRGDELVVVNVEIPAKLTKEQRELFEQLAATLNAAVKPTEKGFLDWLNEALGG